jgi:hypothetical protein
MRFLESRLKSYNFLLEHTLFLQSMLSLPTQLLLACVLYMHDFLCPLRYFRLQMFDLKLVIMF